MNLEDLAIGAVRVYQRTGNRLSRIKINGTALYKSPCKFEPNCSNYMIESIRKRGVWRGIPKGLYRILRCNPFSEGGFDPV